MGYRKERKDKCMTMHVIKRAKQRFKADIDDVYIRQICNRIKNGDDSAEFIYKQSNSVTFYIIHPKPEDPISVDFVAVYQKNKHTLKTIMPTKYLDTGIKDGRSYDSLYDLEWDDGTYSFT